MHDTIEQKAGTRSRILNVAEELVQTRGYNGFSYADVAKELKVTKASLHYHFPSKERLGDALISRYTDRFTDALAAIDADVPGAPAKLEAYTGLYADVLRGDRMCLCGMLAAEYETLPPAIRDGVVSFLDDNEEWLAGVLEQGREDATLRFAGSATEAARGIVGGLQGAMLVARPYGDVARFESAASQLIANLAGIDTP